MIIHFKWQQQGHINLSPTDYPLTLDSGSMCPTSLSRPLQLCAVVAYRQANGISHYTALARYGNQMHEVGDGNLSSALTLQDDLACLLFYATSLSVGCHTGLTNNCQVCYAHASHFCSSQTEGKSVG